MYTANSSHLSVTKTGPITTSGFLSIYLYFCSQFIFLNLLSISQLAQDSYAITLSSSSCSVQDPSIRSKIRKGHNSGGLHFVYFLHLTSSSSADVVATYQLSSFNLWHSTLSHMSDPYLKQLISSHILRDVPFADLSDCLSCRASKYIALPFNTTTTHSLILDILLI